MSNVRTKRGTIAILTGAVLVGIGVVDGNAWVTMVGTSLTGGGAAARPVP